MTTGITAYPNSTLIDRALEFLSSGPLDSPSITSDVLGIPKAPRAIADRLASALLGADPRVMRDHQGRWVLAAGRSGSPTIDECTFAVVDVETTGSSPGKGDRIIEIGIVLVRNGQVEPIMDTLVDPGRPVPWAVTRITRITGEMLRGKPRFEEVVDEVLDALAGRVFVAHNVMFDWRFVDAEVKRARDFRLEGASLCSVKLARRLVPEIKHRGLDSVARYFGIEIEGRHRAGGDATATARALVHLLERAKEQGARTLEDLRAVASRPKRQGRKRRTAGPTWMEDA